MNESELLQALVQFLADHQADGKKCCKPDCSCGVEDTLEQSVARFSERASNVAASQMESFALQTAASNAAIVNMTSRITNPS